MAELLAGADDVDWAGLHHAYASAGDVPTLLRGLLYEEERVRDEALFELYGTVWHQGTVYSVTPVVVPFLMRVLTARSTAPTTRVGVAVLLASIAAPDSYVPDGPGEADLPVLCREAVTEGVSTWGTSLTAAPAYLRVPLLALIACCHPGLPTAVVEEVADFRRGVEGEVALAAEVVLALLRGDEHECARLLRDLADADENAADWMQQAGGRSTVEDVQAVLTILAERDVDPELSQD